MLERLEIQRLLDEANSIDARADKLSQTAQAKLKESERMAASARAYLREVGKLRECAEGRREAARMLQKKRAS